MSDIVIFLLIQLGIIIMILNIWLIRSLYLKNKKLENIVQNQNKYLTDMYETIKYTENRIKVIDQNGIFQGDDEIGFFFKAIKDIQEQLSEYIKFIK
jgi:hypothetical protein